MSQSEELWLVIPTKDRFQYLPSIFENSQVPEHRRLLIRTAPGLPISNCVNLYHLGEINIHRWWNFGIDWAIKHGGRYVAILNDDVRLLDGQLQRMLTQMINEKTALAYGDTSKVSSWGHAYILDLATGLRPDESFSWWFGDNDLAIRAKSLGGISIFPESIEHVEWNATTQSSPLLQALADRDRVTFQTKYQLGG